MNSSMHTPTPWMIEPTFCTIDRSTGDQEIDGFNILTADGKSLIVGQEGIYSDGGQDAEFIVRACNAHDDLVAALRALIPLADEGAWEPAHEDAIDKAEAALAKAGVA